MLVINAGETRLSIDPIHINFILTQEERYKYIAEIDRLNNSVAFTFGIYTYKVITRRDVPNSEIPSDELKSALANNNLFMPLFPDGEGNNYFAFENVDLSMSVEDFWHCAHKFIIETANINRKLVENGIRYKMERREDGYVASVKEDLKILDVLENSVIEAQQEYNTSVRGYFERKIPNLYIERIPTLRYKKEVMRYGVVVEIEGKRTPVMLNGTDQKMLYITALLRYKAGIPLSIHELYNNSRGSKAADIKVDRSKMKEWLTEVYNTIIDNDGNDAESWLNMVARAGKQNLNREEKVRKSHPLPQAKSEANKRIENSLSGNQSAIDCCVLKTVMDENNVTYYSFDIPMEKIFLDEQLQHLVDKFLTYIKKD